MPDPNTPTPAPLAQVLSDTVRYVVQRPIKHSGKDLLIGDVVLFTPKQAIALLADGALKPEIPTPTENRVAVDLSAPDKPAPAPKK